MGLAAFSAFAIDNDARAGAVRAKHSVVNIEGIIFGGDTFRYLGHGCTAGHAKPAFLRYDLAAGRASLSRDLLITMGTFHLNT
jgi:hypothetical protein